MPGTERRKANFGVEMVFAAAEEYLKDVTQRLKPTPVARYSTPCFKSMVGADQSAAPAGAQSCVPRDVFLICCGSCGIVYLFQICFLVSASGSEVGRLPRLQGPAASGKAFHIQREGWLTDTLAIAHCWVFAQ